MEIEKYGKKFRVKFHGDAWIATLLGSERDDNGMLFSGHDEHSSDAAIDRCVDNMRATISRRLRPQGWGESA